jgi:putative ABC transport system substrate-binding protein
MRGFGWVEGRDFVFESLFAPEHLDDLPTLAARLVRTNPDVIVVQSAGLVDMLLKHTTTIPIVALSAGLLTVDEHVASLAKPGGIVTGMQLFSPELMGKRLQLLKELLPGLRRVAVLRGTNYPEALLAVYQDATDAAALALNIRVRYLRFDNSAELDGLFVDIVKEKDQALLVWANPHLLSNVRRIYELVTQYRLPAIYELRPFADGLMVYGPNLNTVTREATRYVDQILKGAKPEDLAIGQPRTFELLINTKAAQAIGLTIPQSLLLRADEVI